MDAADFKTYIFPLLFFKRISDVDDEEFQAALELSAWSSCWALRDAVDYSEQPLARRSGSIYIAAAATCARLGCGKLAKCASTSSARSWCGLTVKRRELLADVGVLAVASEWDLIEARYPGAGR